MKAKSLQVYDQLYKPRHALRTSMANYEEGNWVWNIPLYGVGEYLKRLED
ncbi:MAG: hypothetical protein LBT69_01680 [Lactobacillales bacterium]|nr:hypothetical protein [Lactobacillales bacterium]